MRRFISNTAGVLLFLSAVVVPILTVGPVLWFVAKEIAIGLRLTTGSFSRSAVEFLIPAAFTGLIIEWALRLAARMSNKLDRLIAP